MRKFRIEIKNGSAYVYTPYNYDFVTRIKAKIGKAKWNGEAWCVRESAVDDVRKIMMEIFGETDIYDAEKVSVVCTVKKHVYEYCGGFEIFGKYVICARGRDSGAWAGEDTVILEGNCDSGGSMKNWKTELYAGLKFRVDNVPANLVEAERERCGEDIDIEVVKKDDVDREALYEEKNRLLARIAEIDVLLGNSK